MWSEGSRYLYIEREYLRETRGDKQTDNKRERERGREREGEREKGREREGERERERNKESVNKKCFDQ